MQHFNFRARTQKSEESIGEFVAQLKKSVVQVLWIKGSLEDMLRDHLVAIIIIIHVKRPPGSYYYYYRFN